MLCCVLSIGSGSGGDLHLHLPLPPPPPVIVQVPPGHPVFCIDVECVATGQGPSLQAPRCATLTHLPAGVSHNARSVAQVALVDEWGRPVFNVFVKQDLPVSSYITELTGLGKDTLEQYGMPMGESLPLCLTQP